MDTLAAWVATYLIHSTLLIGGVALVSPWLRRRPEVASPLWKVALVGGVVTATVQIGVGVTPWAGTYALPAEVAASRADVAAAPIESTRATVATATAVAPEAPVGDWEATVLAPPVPSGAARAVAIPPPPPINPKTPPTSAAAPETIDPEPLGRPWWATVLALLLPLGLLVAAASLVLGVHGLSRRLRGRIDIEQGPLRRMLDHLLQRAGSHRRVALTVAPEISIPMATGIMRPEIVVPSRVAEELPVMHAETLLAHELAHVLRFDPAWRVLGLLIGRALFFQPLNRLALRGMADAAEYLCDDWAARHTRRPLDLARCLTEVAGWGRGTPAMAAAAVDAGVPRSVLGRRVQRLLDAKAAPGQGHRVGIAAAGLALVGLVALAPAVAVGEACDPPPRHAGTRAFAYHDGEHMRIEATQDPDGTVELVLDGDIDMDEVGEVMRDLRIEVDPQAVDAAKEPRADRKSKRQHKRKASKARRKAKKDVLQAFREARKNGSPVPSDAEIAEILRRGEAAGAPPSANKGVRLRIVVPTDGEPRVTFESGGESIELQAAIEREVEQALREAERDTRRAIVESQRAREHAERHARQRAQGHHEQAQRHREKAMRQHEQAQRHREKAMRQYRKRTPPSSPDIVLIGVPPEPPAPPLAAPRPPKPPRPTRAPAAPQPPTPPDVVQI